MRWGVMMFPLEDNILEAVKARQRDVKDGVLPKTVQALLPISIAEQTLRRYMARMWQAGKLYRFGGTNARRGYRALRDAESTIEQRVINLLESNPWGLDTEKIAELLGVRDEVVADYLPQMEFRGLLLLNRGVWRVPSLLQRIAFDTCGTFGYRAA